MFLVFSADAPENVSPYSIAGSKIRAVRTYGWSTPYQFPVGAGQSSILDLQARSARGRARRLFWTACAFLPSPPRPWPRRRTDSRMTVRRIWCRQRMLEVTVSSPRPIHWHVLALMCCCMPSRVAPTSSINHIRSLTTSHERPQ